MSMKTEPRKHSIRLTMAASDPALAPEDPQLDAGRGDDQGPHEAVAVVPAQLGESRKFWPYSPTMKVGSSSTEAITVSTFITSFWSFATFAW